MKPRVRISNNVGPSGTITLSGGSYVITGKTAGKGVTDKNEGQVFLFVVRKDGKKIKDSEFIGTEHGARKELFKLLGVKDEKAEGK